MERLQNYKVFEGEKNTGPVQDSKVRGPTTFSIDIFNTVTV